MATSTKSVFLSKTVWGVLIAAAATIADSGDVLSGLLGVEWADKLAVAAGLLLAFWGRLSASTTLKILPALLAVVMIGGCAGPGAGQAAREGLLSPWAVAAWPEVELLAQRGVAAKLEDGELTDQTAAFPRETIRLFGEAVAELGGE